MHNLGIVGRLFFPQQAVELIYSVRISSLDLELKDLLTRVELEVNSRGTRSFVAISYCLLLRKHSEMVNGYPGFNLFPWNMHHLSVKLVHLIVKNCLKRSQVAKGFATHFTGITRKQ